MKPCIRIRQKIPAGVGVIAAITRTAFEHDPFNRQTKQFIIAARSSAPLPPLRRRAVPKASFGFVLCSYVLYYTSKTLWPRLAGCIFELLAPGERLAIVL